jgi:DNA repair protein RecO (recombination protein O)
VIRSAHDRVLLQAAYVLHQRPWRDSSRILELFTHDHGRLTVFSRGTRRPGSRLGSVLQPFHRILVSYSVRGEAGTLMHAEFDGAPVMLASSRLMSGFYLNELLIRLLARHDAHAEVFALYARTLEALRSSIDEAVTLRRFEKRLLEAVGYGLSLAHDVRTGQPVLPDRMYRFVPEEGPSEVLRGVADGLCIVTGAALLAVAAERFDEPASRAEARLILRSALDCHLDGRGLRSREVLRAMQRTRVASAQSRDGQVVREDG